MTTSKYAYQQYINDVSGGKIPVCEYVLLAVKRHLGDLERQDTDEFPYVFNAQEGERWINFAQLCNQWKGTGYAGQPLRLEPWQQFYFVVLFGWKRRDGTRRFRASYLEIARKNGKTSMAAVKALAHLIIDKEPGAQAYIAATKEDQAKICFRDSVEIIKATPFLNTMFKIFTKSITKGNSFIKPLGSDSDTQDGLDVSYGILDELHSHPTSGMLNVLESGMASRRQPLIDIITTAGFNREYPCYTEVRKSSIDILRGTKTDESHFALIYTLDEGDDWEDENNWIKANPNLGVSVRPEFLRDRFQKAKNEGGSKEIDFKTKNLNIWTDTEETWIPDSIWTTCNKQRLDLLQFKGKSAWLGLDLASIRDYAALAIYIPGEVNHVIMRFYIPEDSVRDRQIKENANTYQWIKDGWITTTPGNVTDYDYIYDDIQRIAGILNVRRLAYDRNNSSQLIVKLTDSGIPSIGYAQTTLAFTPPINEMEKLIFSGQLNHEGNPVLRWMASNVVIMRDSNGNRKFTKEKAKNKIDGIVAMGMAVGNWISDPDKDYIANYEIITI